MDDDHLKLVLRPRQRKKGNLKQTLGDDHFVHQFIPLTVSFRQRLNMGNVTSDYNSCSSKSQKRRLHFNLHCVTYQQHTACHSVQPHQHCFFCWPYWQLFSMYWSWGQSTPLCLGVHCHHSLLWHR